MKLPAIARQTHLPTRVAEMICAEVRSGRLKPGDQLPGEQALASSLGVSRNVVREAIARLRSDGIVESRQGVGAFLLRTESASALRFDAGALQDLKEFAHIFELRAVLEIRLAGLAAGRRQPEAMRELRAALEKMRGSGKWEQDGVDADLEFHRALARATGNPYLVKVSAFVTEQMRESIARTREGIGSVAEVVAITIREHEAIYEAVNRGSPAAARRAMSRHIHNAASRLGVGIVVDHRS